MSRLEELKKQVKVLEIQVETLEALKTLIEENIRRFNIDMVSGTSEEPEYNTIDFEDPNEVRELESLIIRILERRIR